MTQYREPGVYLKTNKTGNLNPVSGASRIPLVIGSGPSVLRQTIQLTRSNSGQIDTFPVEVVEIESISLTSGGVNAFTGGELNDYVFDPLANTQLSWNDTKGPTPGGTYYVTVQYKVPDTVFNTPQLCTSSTEIENYVGPDLRIDSAGQICRISLAAQTVLKQGTGAVWVLPVKPSGAVITAADYIKALDSLAAFITSCWRVIPVDVDPAINSAVDAHVTKMSSYEERLERSTIYGAGYTATLSTYPDVKSNVGLYAQSKANPRVNVIYPDTATMQLSDGKIYAVDAAILSAAFAGGEAATQPQQSRTGMGLKGFNQLTGVRMKNSEMNDLATYGVTILTQATTGADIIVRHQLTTDMSSVQNRETSIQDIADTVARTLRGSCRAYIGRYNLTPDVITRISGTLNSAIAQLKSDQTIVDGTIATLMQDINNPDTLVVTASVAVPYPCNYIDITVALA